MTALQARLPEWRDRNNLGSNPGPDALKQFEELFSGFKASIILKNEEVGERKYFLVGGPFKANARFEKLPLC